MKRALFAAIAFVAVMLTPGGAAFAQSAKAPPVALKGYDPVSYFNPGQATIGASKISYDFDEARYLFASAKNRDLFAANPDKYTPQFSGLCATGMGMDGGKYQADPNVFLVREGKLYVFSSTEARAAAEKDPSLLRRAHEQWQRARK